MDPAAALHRLGGMPGHARPVEHTTPARLRGAVERGEVTRLARGRYALPDVDRALSAATRLSGALPLRSAALHHGWAVEWVPPVSEIAVGRTRHSPSSRGVRLVWNADHDPRRLVTGPLDTVIMSARALPFDEALCIADSALREGALTEAQSSDGLPRTCGVQGLRVAAEADRRAANPFESVLRAICLDAGFWKTPQHPVDVGGRLIHPDLVDPSRRLVLEADSWEWHTGKQAHDDDCWRYNALVAHSWVVFRFTWTQVIFGADYVRTILEHARHAEVACVAPVVA